MMNQPRLFINAGRSNRRTTPFLWKGVVSHSTTRITNGNNLLSRDDSDQWEKCGWCPCYFQVQFFDSAA